MYCRDTSLVKHTKDYFRVYCLKCRSWGCEECREDRQKDLRGLARRGAPVLFLTLTVRAQEGDNTHMLARNLARAWRLLRIRIKKKFGIKKIPFLAVFEKTKKGNPHLHILLRSRYLPHAWLSEQMEDLLNSPVVGIERIKDKNKMAAYVTKYISKDLALFEGCKRYWRSQDWELKKHKYVKPAAIPGEYFVRHAAPAYRVLTGFAELGYEVFMSKVGWFAWEAHQRGPPAEAYGPRQGAPCG